MFLSELKKLFEKGELETQQGYEATVSSLLDKQWSVFVTHPTMTSKTIEQYLARYINRIAVTNSRVRYVEQTKKVHLLYNDYRNQKEGEAAPEKEKPMEPLNFIHQVIQHLPPPYFQRCRRYGLHASAKGKATKALIAKKVRAHGCTVRTVCEIVTQLLKLQPWQCEQCGCTEHTKHELRPDKSWKFTYITLPKIRSPVH